MITMARGHEAPQKLEYNYGDPGEVAIKT